jgi:hypothetical protein
MTLTKEDLEDITRFKISLPGWYHRRLLLWAFIKGTNRADLASKVLQARIEANWDGVKEQLEDIAKEKGVTREEIENVILGE